MKFAYKADHTVTGYNRAATEGTDEITGTCTPQHWNVTPPEHSTDVTLYTEVNGVPVAKDNVDEILLQKAKEDKLVADLEAVDVWVSEERAKNFLYDGHMYYPDADSLNALITTMPYKPEDFTMNWKTADLEADGISNIYVLLDKDGIVALGLTLEVRQGTLWAQGDAKKKQIKEEYNS